MRREPVLILSTIQTALVAFVGVLVSFDIWNPTGAQLGALTAFYVAAASIVMVFLRGQVYSPGTVDSMPMITQDMADAVTLVETAPGYQEKELALNALAAKVAASIPSE